MIKHDFGHFKVFSSRTEPEATALNSIRDILHYLAITASAESTDHEHSQPSSSRLTLDTYTAGPHKSTTAEIPGIAPCNPINACWYLALLASSTAELPPMPVDANFVTRKTRLVPEP